MTNQDVVISILSECGCKTTKEISAMAIRKFNCEMTPHSIGGILRKLINNGKAACSNCGYGATVYWLINQPWEDEKC